MEALFQLSAEQIQELQQAESEEGFAKGSSETARAWRRAEALRTLNKVVERKSRQVRRLRAENLELRQALERAMVLVVQCSQGPVIVGPVRMTGADREGLKMIASVATDGAV